MNQKSPASEKLRALRVRADLSIRELADRLGLPHSTYASYENKYKKQFLPIDLINSLKPILIPLGIPELDLISLSGLTNTSNIRYTPRPEARESVGRMATIIEMDVRGSAGAGAIVDSDRPIAEWKMPSSLVQYATNSSTDQIKIITVIGDSMEPGFRTLDKVMVDINDKVPSPPGIFVVWDGMGLVVKRVEYTPHSDPPTVTIKSDNDKYAPYQRTVDEAHIQGRVLGKWLWV